MAQDTELAGHMLGGGYRLVRRIGEEVPALYEVRHPRLAGRFAARLWPPTIPWDAFRPGAELAAVLRHPGVVQVIDFNCEPGASPFLVLEWVEGTKLSDLLAASGLLPVPRVAALVESVAWALAAAHQQGVVHQELSPAEIFVVQAAGTTREWTKVDGFGVAAALSRVGATAPSPYRAPEQVAPEDEGADPQSDQYALAAIAYEMLSGVRPIEDDRSPGRPPPLTELAHDVTSTVDAVVRQALAPDPEERFAGVLEFARALRDAAHGGSTQVVRRRKTDGRAAGRGRDADGDAPVSPFFNPIQAAGGGDRAPLFSAGAWRALLSQVLPGGVSARVALALGALLLAFGSVAVALRKPVRRAHPPVAAVAPRPAIVQRPAVSGGPPGLLPAQSPAPAPSSLASALAPINAASPKPAAAAETPALPTLAVKMAPQVEPLSGSADKPESSPVRPVPARRARPARPPAQTAARAAAVAAPSAAVVAPPSAAVVAPAAAAPTPARAPAAPAPARAAAAPASAPARAVAAPALAPPATGPCQLYVASHPPAELWLDGRNTGRRTPVSGLQVGCGDHRLVLKRDDLELYQMEMITVRSGTPFRKTYPLR